MTRNRLPTFDECCHAVVGALDAEQPWWRDCFEPEEVADWIRERWPLRGPDASDTVRLALRCLEEMEEAGLDELAWDG